MRISTWCSGFHARFGFIAAIVHPVPKWYQPSGSGQIPGPILLSRLPADHRSHRGFQPTLRFLLAIRSAKAPEVETRDGSTSQVSRVKARGRLHRIRDESEPPWRYSSQAPCPRPVRPPADRDLHHRADAATPAVNRLILTAERRLAARSNAGRPRAVLAGGCADVRSRRGGTGRAPARIGGWRQSCAP
jgi:hypothetical protein